MCVIVTSAKGEKIAESTARLMWQTNPDGAGLAWAEKGHVRIAKGLMTWETFASTYATIKEGTPHVVHFRISTVGGIRPDLTHPFVISERSPFVMKGKIRRPVLFHNGHWNEWQDTLLASTVALGRQIPDGPLSDSRALAVLAARHGNVPAMLSGQRVAILHHDGMIDHPCGIWLPVGEADRSIMASNLSWRPIPAVQYSKGKNKGNGKGIHADVQDASYHMREGRRTSFPDADDIWLGSEYAAVQRALETMD